jgi:hypothetical protein
MKKLFLISMLAFSVSGSAQSFYNGALVIDANTGIEVYNTELHVHNKVVNKDTVAADRAGNLHFGFGAEYGFHANLGAGLRFKTSNYFVEKDTTGQGQEKIKSNDIIAEFSYHPFPRNNFDLVLGGNAGYSAIKFNFNDKDKTVVTSSGAFYSFFVSPRFYFGRFGINLKFYTPFYNYPELKSSNPEFTKEQSYRLKGIPGFGMDFGIQLRLLDERKKEESNKNEGH